MSRKRWLATAVAVLGVLALTGSPALATHSHVMQIGNGQCVVISENAGEEGVALPEVIFDNNPHVDIDPAPERMHPLHILVHQGLPGEQNRIQVYGSPAGDAMCAAGYVNR